MKLFPFAPVALLSFALSAHAYVLNFDDAFLVKHWNLLTTQDGVSTNVVNTNTHAIRYFLASDAYSTTNTANELNAIRASFGQWQSVSGTYIKFEEAGLVSPPVDVNLDDHTNIVYWAKTSTLVNGGNDDISGALGVTFTTWDPTSNIILEGDIVFNGVEYTWFTDFNDTSNPATFVEAVASHEIGHFLGVAHSPVGGATMLFRGASGVNVQTGLSDDDIAGGRYLYPMVPTNFGAVKGTVTKSGSPVLGAAVFAQTSVSNVAAGTVTLPNGTYEINSLAAGTYQIRVTPLDPFVGDRLVAGYDIANSPDSTNSDFTSADTDFLPTTNVTTVIVANTTNTVNFAVTAATPVFSITHIRAPTASSGSFSWSSLPTSIKVGQSNYFIGVASASIPSNNASLLITGDGLTLGTASFLTNAFMSGLNFISVPISVASNATPGLRSFIVSQGANVAYANGFLDVMAAVPDYNFDGLDDTFQRQYFALFTSPQAAPGADPDGDGMNNAGEYVAGTIPTNTASVLKMLVLTNTPSGTTVSWQSVVGKRYQVSSRTNLTIGSWQNIGGVVTAINTAAQYFDPTATNGMGYYRVQVLP